MSRVVLGNKQTRANCTLISGESMNSPWHPHGICESDTSSIADDSILSKLEEICYITQNTACCNLVVTNRHLQRFCLWNSGFQISLEQFF
jgi:hypothetical protein